MAEGLLPDILSGDLPSLVNDTTRPGSHACLSKNCGEAGCVLLGNRPTCLCADRTNLNVSTWLPPDVHLRCNRTAINKVNPDGFPDSSNSNKQYPFEMDNKHGGREEHGKKEVKVSDEAGSLLDGSDVIQLSSQSVPFDDSRLVISISPLDGSQATLIDLRILLSIIIAASFLVITALVVAIILHYRHRHKLPPFHRSTSLRSGGGAKGVVKVGGVNKQENTLLLEHMSIISRNHAYFTAPTDATDAVFLASLHARQISRDTLTCHEEIGEGAFGKVYKGELKWSENDVINVAIKILKRDASRETRDDFRREVEIMSGFAHDNILRLLGISSSEDQLPCMVFEYMELGDLAELLRGNDPSLSSRRKTSLKVPHLVNIARQIAHGMSYLASQHFVHRDLATRNCLVSRDLVVKISDFGMSRDIYTCDYYKVGGVRMLPVRWMSPEAVKYGRYTTESDVWAYGVVLWEIFTYGRQPYYGHSNEEVIRFIEEEILLQRPSHCPDTVYHVMLGCWRSDAKDRFSFERIHRYLTEYVDEMAACSLRAAETSRRHKMASTATPTVVIRNADVIALTSPSTDVIA